jgi:lysophospholipase
MGNTPYGFLQARDGIRLRYGFWPRQKKCHGGAVVVLGGRAEYMEKYIETIDEINIRGFDVFSLDWRGQGLSDRMLADRTRGYVRTFEEYVADLKLFLDEIVKPGSEGPLILMAHSMGGTIVLHYLRQHPQVIDKAVLLSPMISFRTKPLPSTIAKAYCRLLVAFGKAHCTVPAMRRSDSFRGAFAGNWLTHDATRFDRVRQLLLKNPQLLVVGVTYGWLAASFKAVDAFQHAGFAQSIQIPILVVMAGRDRVVSNAATKRFVAQLPAQRTICVEGAYHEILQERDEMRAQFWRAFDRFILQSRSEPRCCI